MTVLRLLTAAQLWAVQQPPAARVEAPTAQPASSGCSLSLQRAKILGDVDRQIVRRVSAHHRAQLCRCAQQAPRTASESVTIAYVIDPAGEVPRALVSSSTAADVVAACIAAEIQTWRFPRGPCGMAQIEQTLELLPVVELPPGPEEELF